MDKNSKIYIAGHKGMVGSAIWKHLNSKGFYNLIGKTSKELDLRNQSDVFNFYQNEKPNIVIDAAAKVGGILANNSFPYQFIMDNLLIQNNLIDSAHKTNVEKFIFLGSSCIYPKLAPQPLKEEYLLTLPLEPTNEWYAIAKIAGVKSCEAIKKQFGKEFISLMPTNLYGPNDNFDLISSHVLPAMMRKFHEAKVNNKTEIELWGSGSVFREFMHVDDLAEAVCFAIENKLEKSLYNVGSGVDLTIKDLALLIQKTVEHKGNIKWDNSKPDGSPRKLMDVSKLKELGWESQIKLEDGIKQTYQWFLSHQEDYKTVKF